LADNPAFDTDDADALAVLHPQLTDGRENEQIVVRGREEEKIP
jgi:hypothetical protein